MKCKSNSSQNYKKSFFQKFLDFIDKITYWDNENELTDKEAEYVNEHFDDVRFKRRK